MKATGIVRRIDDLGRIVIPKEIRRTMGIREGDPLEIFTEDNSIIFSKYDGINEEEEITKSKEEKIVVKIVCENSIEYMRLTYSQHKLLLFLAENKFLNKNACITVVNDINIIEF